MRKAARIVFLFFLGLLSSALLGVITAVMTAVALAATAPIALVVPGTGTPNANIVTNYMQQARDRFMRTTSCTATSSPSCTLTGIDYPASFWPIPIGNWCPGLTCDTWNKSVGEGVANLDRQLRPLLADPNGGPIVVFGYSQGGRVVGLEKMALANLTPEQKARIKIVTIGDIGTPNGGLWPRLPNITIPIWNVTFGLPTPTNTGIASENYAFEFDLVGDSPNFWGNALALFNSIAAVEYVHGDYLTPNGNDELNGLPYGYTDIELQAAINNPANRQTFGDTTYVLIPAKGTLPLLRPIEDFAASTGLTPIVKPFISLFNPILTELVRLGYDRSINRGIPTLLSPLPFKPFQNWVEVGLRLAVAAAQGIQAFIGDLGASTTTVAPPGPVPAPMSTLASVAPVDTSEEATPGTERLSDPEEKSTPEPTLRLVQDGDSEAIVEELNTVVEDDTSTGDTSTEAEDETTPSAVEEPAADDQKAADDQTDSSEPTTPGATADDKKAADDKKVADDQKAADDQKPADNDDSKDADNEKAAA